MLVYRISTRDNNNTIIITTTTKNTDEGSAVSGGGRDVLCHRLSSFVCWTTDGVVTLVEGSRSGPATRGEAVAHTARGGWVWTRIDCEPCTALLHPLSFYLLLWLSLLPILTLACLLYLPLYPLLLFLFRLF